MKLTVKILFVISLLSSQIALSQHQIIPEPVSYQGTDSHLLIEEELQLDLLSSNDQIVNYLDQFKGKLKSLGISLTAMDPDNTNAKFLKIELDSLEDENSGPEGYQLTIDSLGIELKANQAPGIFNGLQTLSQLMPVASTATTTNLGQLQIETCEILDYPRFPWRGLMLDVSRHFFTVEEIKDYLDQMAKYKYNVFHWHLTDDEGWRIEIKTFSKLTEVGAWRVQRHGKFGPKRAAPKRDEKATYGGFYSQEEVKDIVAYAAARNITVVPEIDVPGHSMALLAAYPQFSTKKQFKYVNPGAKFADWYGDGTFKMNIENMLNPADPAVYAFLDMVFTEVAGLFPGEYIHMGGDECYHGYWEEDPKVQAFMAENGIKDSHALQSYFVKRVAKIISDKGKKMIGWDEIQEGGLAEGAAVMSWRSMEGGINAARSGHPVVMTPKTFVYLDYTQGDHSVENIIYSDLSLERAYSFDPMPNPNLFVDIDQDLILGGQGNLWTEAVPNLPYAYYMTYPRALALSEVFWTSNKNKNWEDFLRRTETHFDRFDAEGVNIAKVIYEPVVKVKNSGRKLSCSLKTPFEGIEIYYTIDNTYPIKNGHKYQGPFDIPQGDFYLRTQSFRNGQPIGRILRIHRDELEKRAAKK